MNGPPVTPRLALIIICAAALPLAAWGGESRSPDSALPLTLSAYLTELNRWTSDLGELTDHPELAAKLRRDLPATWRVTAGGESVEVSTRWLVDGLEDIQRDPKAAFDTVERMRTRLQAMRQEATDLEKEAPRSDSMVRTKLNDILARREFRTVRGPSGLDRLLNRMVDWLIRSINRLGPRVTRHRKLVEFLFWGFLIASMCGLMAWMVRRLLLRQGSQEFRLAAPQFVETTSWQRMVEQARKGAERGQYRQAIRMAHGAAVLRLEETGMWSVDRARTHREYLRLLRPDQAQREPFSVLTGKYELAWYGCQPSSQDDFQTVWVQLEKLGCA